MSGRFNTNLSQLGSKPGKKADLYGTIFSRIVQSNEKHFRIFPAKKFRKAQKYALIIRFFQICTFDDLNSQIFVLSKQTNFIFCSYNC